MGRRAVKVGSVVAFAALGGLASVAMGAMAAHAFASLLEPRALGWIAIGARVGGWNAAALLGVAALMAARPGRWLAPAAAALALGILLFSGSLYGLALTNARAFAYVTPFGGVALLIGWGLLVAYGIVEKGR